jgi:hypothetical protein
LVGRVRIGVQQLEENISARVFQSITSIKRGREKNALQITANDQGGARATGRLMNNIRERPPPALLGAPCG